MNLPGGLSSSTERESYGRFLEEVLRSGLLWAVWAEDSWATGDDPSGKKSGLFLLWRTKQDAEEALSHCREKFPPGAVVDSISLEKWLGPYTQDLAMHNDAPFLCTDRELRGLQVDPVAFQQDLVKARSKPTLQGSDLTRLKSTAKQKRSKR